MIKKPASTFTTVAGSSQVKWNRKNKHLFASAHDGDVRIWDNRVGLLNSSFSIDDGCWLLLL